jgi:hypothetical protein
MKKMFLVVCPSASSPAVVSALDKNPHVLEWSQIWPGAIIIKTDAATAKEAIIAYLHSSFALDYFMVADFMVPQTVEGWVDKKVWGFINDR